MSNLKTIIEATLAQKPLTVKEAIDEIMAEKCRAIVDNIQPEFGNAVMEEQEEAAEMQNFFEAFHADHGDKPIEEQLEIMEAFEAELAEKKHDKEEEDGDVKPDFLDLDDDGNKKEPMKKAVKDKKTDKSKVISELSPETRARYAGAAAKNIADLADKRSEADAELYRSKKMGQRVSDPKKQQELSAERWKQEKKSEKLTNKIKRRQDGIVRAVKGKE
jgi:hypothetical protein